MIFSRRSGIISLRKVPSSTPFQSVIGSKRDSVGNASLRSLWVHPDCRRYTRWRRELSNISFLKKRIEERDRIIGREHFDTITTEVEGFFSDFCLDCIERFLI